MIKYLLNEEEKRTAIKLCNDILSDRITPDYIVNSLDNLSIILDRIMPDDYIYSDLARDNSILIDDILGMDSISEVQKEEAIAEVILSDMQEFTTLAKDILTKIKFDEIETEKSGYCKKLLEDNKIYTKEDFAIDFKNRLSETIDPNNAINWAFSKLQDNRFNSENEVYDIIQKLQLGDRQWTIQELIKFANKLIEKT